MGKSIYQNIANVIEAKINDGIYKINDRLPSERDLTKIYNCSRMTIRHAIQLLEEKKIIYKIKGSGTYIKHPSFEQNNVKSFTETVESQGYKSSSKILEFSIISKSEKISNILEVPIDTKFYKIKRLRYGNDFAMALENLYIPCEYLENLEKYDLKESFYDILEKEYNINIELVSCKVEAIIANPIYIKLLNLTKPTALLKITGINIDNYNKKFSYEESIYRSDLYNYNIDFHRKR